MGNAEKKNQKTAGVDALVSCIDDIKRKLVPTGVITPAGGICYIDTVNDVCAAIYNNGGMAKVFSDRKNEFKGREMWPCFFKDRVVLYG